MEKTYMAIDLKSFYASVECVMRSRDPLTTNLVVADKSRTDKTICLAVSPALKSFGVSGRPRLFEVVQKVEEINKERERKTPGGKFLACSNDSRELAKDPTLRLDYITARPHMAEYIKVSNDIYQIYLRYIAPEDIFVYSIDEVFLDATNYLNLYHLSAYELAEKLTKAIFTETGITATVGIGTNMYLCKIAMDIIAKKKSPDANGARIAQLDEMSYRRELWDHRPLTDFWRVGRGYASKLEAHNMFTMGDIALKSLHSEDTLYKLFGVNAEPLIDHAWGWEPVTIEQIKAYKPASNSVSSGQVLPYGYESSKARLLVREMAELLSLDLVSKCLVTDQMVLTVCYDAVNVSSLRYKGEVELDFYGKSVPKKAHGSINLKSFTSSTKQIVESSLELYDRIANKTLLVRRLYIVANHILRAGSIMSSSAFEQLNIFAAENFCKENDADYEKEKLIQNAMLNIQEKFGKNAILKCYNLYDWAKTKERNGQIGGHKS